jgi:hypothetical protein
MGSHITYKLYIKLVSNYKELYILTVVKKYVTVLSLNWSGWKYIVYKLLTYGYLYDLSQLGRY